MVPRIPSRKIKKNIFDKQENQGAANLYGVFRSKIFGILIL
jgi:hypothetical protein